jgi:hypothetical protein
LDSGVLSRRNDLCLLARVCMLNRSPRLPFRLKRLHPLHRPWSNRHRSRCLRLQQTRRQHPPACATFWLNYPPDPIAEEVAEQLPVLTREIDARLRETRKIVAQRASLEILVGLESEWRRLRRNLAGWTRDLTNRATSLEHQIAELDELERPGNKHSMRPRVRTHRPRYFIASKPLSPRSGRHGKRSKNKEHGY